MPRRASAICGMSDLWRTGSPVGAVGLVLRAINKVKLDRARLELGWVTRLTVSIGHWL